MAATIRWFWIMFERSNIPCGTNGELGAIPCASDFAQYSRHVLQHCYTRDDKGYLLGRRAMCFGVAVRAVEVGGGTISARL